MKRILPILLLWTATAFGATYYVGPSATGSGDGSNDSNLMAWANVATQTAGGDSIYLVGPDATTIFYPYENGGTVSVPVPYVEWPDRLYYSKSVMQYGITVNFNNTYQRIGRFINGDYWVVGPVTIDSYTPAYYEYGTVSVARNGMMIDPQASGQGLSARKFAASYYDPGYVDALNYGDQLPQTISTYPASVLIATSIDDADPRFAVSSFYHILETVSVLTVLDSGIANNIWFRPSWRKWTGRAVEYQWSAVQTGLLGTATLNCPTRINQVDGDTLTSSLERLTNRPYLDLCGGWISEATRPVQHSEDYGRDLARDTGAAFLALHDGQWTVTQKKKLLINCLQIGIDFSGIYRAGETGWWLGDGAHGAGRYWPILFAGIMFDDPDLYNIGVDGHADDDTCTDPAYVSFGENDQTYLVRSVDVASQPYVLAQYTPRDNSGTVSVTNGSVTVWANAGDTWPGVVAGDNFMTTTDAGATRYCLDQVRGYSPSSKAYVIASVNKTAQPYSLTLTEPYQGASNGAAYFTICDELYLGRQHEYDNRWSGSPECDEYVASDIGRAWWSERVAFGAYNKSSPTYGQATYQDVASPCMAGAAFSAMLMQSNAQAIEKWNSPPFFGYIGTLLAGGQTSLWPWWGANAMEATYWTLDTTASAASAPSPTHGATGVAIGAVLSWTDGEAWAQTFDVYFGTDSTPDAGELVSSGQAASSYDPPGDLGNGVTYYWQIVAHGYFGGIVTGPVWSFTTEAQTARTFYVDSAAAGGGNGSFDTPWDQLADITGIIPGDTILLKRGSLFREGLTLSVDGTAVNRVTLGAYGTGNDPILSGSNLVTGWSVYSGNVWRASLGTQPRLLLFNATVWTGTAGRQEIGLGDVDSDLDWYYSGGYLYLYSTSDPDTRWTNPGVEAAIRDVDNADGLVIIQGDYVTLENIIVTQAANRGIELEAPASPIIRNCAVTWGYGGGIVHPDITPGSTDVLIEDCTVTRTNMRHWDDDPYRPVELPGAWENHESITLSRVNGGVIRRCRVYTNYQEGIAVKYGASNIDIYHNVCYENGFVPTGIWLNIIQIYLDGSHDCDIYQNYCYGGNASPYKDNVMGIVIGRETDDWPTYNINAWGNVIRDCSNGIQVGTVGGPNIDMHDLYFVNNTIVSCSIAGLIARTSAEDDLAAPIWIRNNLFWQDAGNAIYDETTGNDLLTVATITDNGFRTGQASETKGTAYIETSTHGFANIGGYDYSLTGTSPFIDQGFTAGQPYDNCLASGATWPGSVTVADQDSYDAWEMGAYVWASGGPVGITTTFYGGTANEITVTWKYNSVSGNTGRFIGPQDYWVADASGITIMDVTPRTTPATLFAAVNPNAGYGQPQGLSPHISNYQASLNLLASFDPANPATWINVPTDSSVVFLLEYAVETDATWARAAAVLTVLQAAPVADSFRPPWTAKTIQYDTVPPSGYDPAGDAACRAWWRIESGALGTDSSTAGNTLTNTGVTASATAYEGSASGSFVAAETDHLTITDAALVSTFPLKSGATLGGLTVCYAVQYTAFAADMWQFSKYDAPTNQRSLALRTVAAGPYVEVLKGHTSGTGYEALAHASGLQTGRWYHVTFTYDEPTKYGTLRIWDDTAGAWLGATATKTFTNATSLTAAPFHIGAGAGLTPGSPHNGLLDDVLVFSRVLTDIEIGEVVAQTFGASAGSSVPILPNAADLNMSAFANVTDPGSGPSFATCEAWLANPMLDWCLAWEDFEEGSPRASMPRTGLDLASRMNAAALKLNCNYSNAEKQTLAAYLTQYGLDLGGILTVNYGTTRGWMNHDTADLDNWYQGRLIPFVVAARTLNDTTLAARLAKTGDYLWGGASYPADAWFFGECVQTRLLAAGDVGSQTQWIGAPDFAKNGRRTAWTGPAYPRTSEAGAEPFCSAAMVLYLMQATGWGDFDGLLDYADLRWYVAGGQFTNQASYYPDWQEAFYANFRNDYAGVQPRVDLVTAAAGADQAVGYGDRLTIALDGSGSHNWWTNQTATAYVWTQGAAQVATGVTPTIALDPGAHVLTLTVTDAASGDFATDTVTITVAQPPGGGAAGYLMLRSDP